MCFQSCTLRGTLKKLGKNVKVWTDRRCIVTAKVLQYTHAAYAGKYKGLDRTIPLEDITHVANKRVEGKHRIELVLWTGEEVVFATDSAEQAVHWCSTLERLCRAVLQQVADMPVMRGKVSKLGKVLKVWRPRLCVLTADTLAYSPGWKKGGAMTRILLADMQRVYLNPVGKGSDAVSTFSVALWTGILLRTNTHNHAQPRTPTHILTHTHTHTRARARTHTYAHTHTSAHPHTPSHTLAHTKVNQVSFAPRVRNRRDVG